ncbi:MAG: flagellar type III secretion system pore protein FliP [Pirellulales bacterium]
MPRKFAVAPETSTSFGCWYRRYGQFGLLVGIWLAVQVSGPMLRISAQEWLAPQRAGAESAPGEFLPGTAPLSLAPLPPATTLGRAASETRSTAADESTDIVRRDTAVRPAAWEETSPPAEEPEETSKQQVADDPTSPAATANAAGAELVSRWLGGSGGSWSQVALLSALSLLPAVLLMTTCFVRITVVLGILRQALGMNQLPPTQVLTALSLFMTALVMTPVWSDVYEQLQQSPPSATSPQSWEQTWERGVRPLRQFMSRQIDRAGNSDDVWLFYSHLPDRSSRAVPETYDDVPLQVLLPAFLLSELKVAFLIGFQICLPFLIVDLVVASVTTSMGMIMLPPHVISLPLKLLLFVLLDGWRLVVGMLLDSFAPYS